MSRHRLPFATRSAAACVAAVAATLALHVPARAGEVVTRDCLHGSGENHTLGSRTTYGEAYGSDYGNQYGSTYSYSRPYDGGFHRGFGGRFHRGFVDRAGDQNGGGSIAGANAGSTNGYRDGYTNGSSVASRDAYGADSCVEIRHELTNPYVIPVPPPRSEAEARDIDAHERLWRARCRPVARQDRYGVNRYVYAAPGCEYGKYE
jgi:hypothetical protein